MDYAKYFVAFLVGIVATVAGMMVFQTPKSGATPGNDFFNPVYFAAGVSNGGIVATSSPGDQTVTAAQFKNWITSSLVSFTPTTTLVPTLTLPASSTLSSMLPKAGDSASFCIQNATATPATYVTLAGGAGTKLLVASSSVSALGSTKIMTGKVGCVRIIREAATSTAYDFSALLTVFQ